MNTLENLLREELGLFEGRIIDEALKGELISHLLSKFPRVPYPYKMGVYSDADFDPDILDEYVYDGEGV